MELLDRSSTVDLLQSQVVPSNLDLMASSSGSDSTDDLLLWYAASTTSGSSLSSHQLDTSSSTNNNHHAVPSTSSSLASYPSCPQLRRQHSMSTLSTLRYHQQSLHSNIHRCRVMLSQPNLTTCLTDHLLPLDAVAALPPINDDVIVSRVDDFIDVDIIGQSGGSDLPISSTPPSPSTNTETHQSVVSDRSSPTPAPSTSRSVNNYISLSPLQRHHPVAPPTRRDRRHRHHRHNNANIPSTSQSNASSLPYSSLHYYSSPTSSSYSSSTPIPSEDDLADNLDVPTTTTSPVVSVPVHELSSGNSLTCTFVNILRGLRLLDNCSLEDLCRSLHPNSTNNRQNTISSPLSDQTIASTPSIYANDNCRCLVNYLLTASRQGSIHLRSSSLIYRQTSGNCLDDNDELLGRSDRLVTIIPQPTPSTSSLSTESINHLLLGRFLSSISGWQSLPPPPSTSFTDPQQSTNHVDDNSQQAKCHQLYTWLAAWMRAGAVIVLAQLDDSHCSSGSSIEPNSSFSRRPNDQLVWSHRLIARLEPNYRLCLSNPVETVSTSFLLTQLARQPVLEIDKRRLLTIWSTSTALINNNLEAASTLQPSDDEVEDDEMGFVRPNRSVTTSNRSSTSCYCLSSSSTNINRHCTNDLAALASQRDEPRWIGLNVIGQIISTLRAAEPSQPGGQVPSTSLSPGSGNEQASLSPFITIPSSQSPGLSLFISRDNTCLVEWLRRWTTTNGDSGS